MSKSLLVPIHLDALYLPEEEAVLDTMVDYSDLPQNPGSLENADNLNLAETALAPLFSKELRLPPGIHLHWAIPDALTNGKHEFEETTFPQVPNRWLIVRQKGGTTKKWVVESDYLYPASEDESHLNAINVLIEPPALVTIDDPQNYTPNRYRGMGRSLELAEWNLEDTPSNDYASALTAIGTKATIPIFDKVKATFAAFYPNCYSVFGFNDTEFSKDNPPVDLQYDVIGWYSDSLDDCMTKFLDENGDEEDLEKLLELLQQEFSWTFELNCISRRITYRKRLQLIT